jgi:hypothetical protein
MKVNLHTSHPSAFISSTFIDLQGERAAVAEQLKENGYCQLIEVSWREQILRGPCQILDATNPSPFIKCSFTKYSVITGFHMMSAKSKQAIDNTVTR